MPPFRPTKLIALISIVVVVGTRAPGADQPNFVLILSDDLTYTDAALYGGQAATPHLDKLAAEGMRFDRVFQSASMCSPTRQALYTGLHPVRSGAWPNHSFVREGVRSLAHYLQSVGYRTALSGKTHINPPAAFPFEYLPKREGVPDPDLWGVDPFLAECRSGGTPFALVLCSRQPHPPWDLGDLAAYPPDQVQLPPLFPDTPTTRREFAGYLAEITFFDQQLGAILAMLDRHEVADKTVVMVLTEQGSSFPFAKWTCYDKGLASGMVVRWPGNIEPGSSTRAMVEYLDILPTLLELAGHEPVSELDGESLAAIWYGGKDHHKDYVFGHQSSVGIYNGPGHYGIRTVRDTRYRYIRNLSPERTFQNWCTARTWWREWEELAAAGDPVAVTAVHRYQHRPAEELYDCEADPWNRYNLAKDPAYAPILAHLSAKLDAHMKAIGDKGLATELEGLERQWDNAFKIPLDP